MTIYDAIQLVKKDIQDGHALRYSVESGSLYVESDQGWNRIWPMDDVTDLGSNDSLE